MIIQEAFTFGRPVICSDIGGMAEKVRDGIDGIHVETGSMVAWADVLRRVLSNGLTQWEELRAGIRQPVSGRQTANSHLDLVVGGVDLVS
jgi:glycosyltransferase involved in cell wall biosynthesis